MKKNTYDNGDSNFSAYLAYLGYESEVKVVENENRKPNVIFVFEGDKQEFSNIYKTYRFDEITLNLARYARFKDETFRRVKDTLRAYYNDKN